MASCDLEIVKNKAGEMQQAPVLVQDSLFRYACGLQTAEQIATNFLAIPEPTWSKNTSSLIANAAELEGLTREEKMALHSRLSKPAQHQPATLSKVSDVHYYRFNGHHAERAESLARHTQQISDQLGLLDQAQITIEVLAAQKAQGRLTRLLDHLDKSFKLTQSTPKQITFMSHDNTTAVILKADAAGCLTLNLESTTADPEADTKTSYKLWGSSFGEAVTHLNKTISKLTTELTTRLQRLLTTDPTKADHDSIEFNEKDQGMTIAYLFGGDLIAISHIPKNAPTTYHTLQATFKANPELLAPLQAKIKAAPKEAKDD